MSNHNKISPWKKQFYINHLRHLNYIAQSNYCIIEAFNRSFSKTDLEAKDGYKFDKIIKFVRISISLQIHVSNTSNSPPRWNSLGRGKGGLSTKKFHPSASTMRVQLIVAATTVRPTDLLNNNIKTWVNSD